MKEDTIVWIGLDVHAASITLARLDGDSANAAVESFPNEPKVIKRVFGKLRKEGRLRVCYEAGPCGYEVARQLRSMQVDCVVVAPSLIPRKPGERVKTDRRDAIKLARLYRAGELTSVWVPEAEDEALRDVLRARDDHRKARTTARNRLRSFLLRRGRRFLGENGGKTNWTKKHWQWLKEQTFALPDEKFVFDQYMARVLELDESIKAFDRRIAERAESDKYKARVARLKVLKGIQTLSAMVILSELYDLRRFEHPKQMMAFIGIVPSEYSSGSRERRGRITKTGNAHVRRILVEAAHGYGRGSRLLTARQRDALRSQPPEIAAIARNATPRLHLRFRKLVRLGKKENVAAVAVARELCGFLWALDTAA